HGPPRTGQEFNLRRGADRVSASMGLWGLGLPPRQLTAGASRRRAGEQSMSEDQQVAIITGGSQGIGAALVAGYRQRGWAVVATSRTIRPAADPDVLTVDGDVSDPATTDRIIAGALGPFGRIDTLVN